MTEAQITALIESAVIKAVAGVSAPVKLLESRARKGDALVEANRVLAPLSLNEAWKQEVIRNVIGEDGSGIPVKEGAIDNPKLGELIMAEAKRFVSIIGAGSPSLVRDMGVGSPLGEVMSPKKLLKEAKRKAELEKLQHDSSVNVWESLGMPKNAAELAAKGRAA